MCSSDQKNNISPLSFFFPILLNMQEDNTQFFRITNNYPFITFWMKLKKGVSIQFFNKEAYSKTLNFRSIPFFHTVFFSKAIRWLEFQMPIPAYPIVIIRRGFIFLLRLIWKKWLRKKLFSLTLVKESPRIAFSQCHAIHWNELKSRSTLSLFQCILDFIMIITFSVVMNIKISEINNTFKVVINWRISNINAGKYKVIINEVSDFCSRRPYKKNESGGSEVRG